MYNLADVNERTYAKGKFKSPGKYIILSYIYFLMAYCVCNKTPTNNFGTRDVPPSNCFHHGGRQGSYVRFRLLL